MFDVFHRHEGSGRLYFGAREIVFWGDGEQEYLDSDTKKDAIESMLDGMDEPMPTRITVCGYARMQVPKTHFDARNIVDDMIVSLDEEYGGRTWR